jgi:DNA end-binding protein Ku
VLELASHIVRTKAGHFHPDKFEDHYEDALKELLKKKQSGQKIEKRHESASRPRSSISWTHCVGVSRRNAAAGNGESQREVQAIIERPRKPDAQARGVRRARISLRSLQYAQTEGHHEQNNPYRGNRASRLDRRSSPS